MSYLIGSLAKAAEVGVETVRYYQRRGLMPVPERFGYGSPVRRYEKEDLHRLRFIRKAQKAGFTLSEIADLLALDRQTDRAAIRDLARTRLDALDREIAELQDARAALSRLARDCAKGNSGPCPIIEAFDEQSVG